MTSRKPGGLSTRSLSEDTTKTRRMGGSLGLNNNTEKLQYSKRTGLERRDSSQIGIPSRIPSAIRKQGSRSDSTYTKPPLSHLNHSRGTGSGGGSIGGGRYVTTFPAPAPASAPATVSVVPLTAKPQRNVLRRKRSGLSKEPNHIVSSMQGLKTNPLLTNSSSVTRPSLSREPSVTPSLDRNLTESPMELHTAHTIEISKATPHATTIYPELDRYRNFQPPHRSQSPVGIPKISTQDLPPPTPVFSGTSSHSQLSGYSASPSTRFSESPGPGPYSRDTTPTSMCSQSPGIIGAMRISAPRLRQGSISPSRIRPLPARRRPGSISGDGDCQNADPYGLAAVRESLNSSSSNSTVRDLDKKEKPRLKGNLPPPPPSPPLRKSSQKLRKESKDEGETRITGSSAKQPLQGIIASPPPSKLSAAGRNNLTTTTKTPPVRPSRDGTPDLQSQQLPPPVIQSNLSSSSIHERRPSASLMPSALPKSNTFPSRLAPRREPTPAPVGAGADKPTTSKEGRSTRTPSPGLSNLRSRFPIFSRRKTEPTVSTQEKAASKPSRRGPAAGTGHEGYGKIGKIGAVRRRSSSNTTSASSRGLPSSQESLITNDSFLMDRVNPVIIAGGEIVENKNTAAELNREGNTGSVDDFTSSSSKSSQDGRTPMWPAALQPDKDTVVGTNSRRPSNASTTDAEVPISKMKNTIAFRRSIQKLKASPNSQINMPKPIVVCHPGTVTSPSATSLESGGIMSDDSTVPPQYNPLPASTGPRKLTKKPGRWNFFGRSQAKKAIEGSNSLSTIVSTKATDNPKRAVAYYAMVDTSEQEEGNMDVQDALYHANVLPSHALLAQTNWRPTTSANETRHSTVAPLHKYRPSTILTGTLLGQNPSPSSSNIPQLDHQQNLSGTSASIPPSKSIAHGRSASTSAIPTSVLTMVDPFTTKEISHTPAKRSRLPQVGRIPKVVSSRPSPQPQPQPLHLEVPPSPRSFSRPFYLQNIDTYTPPHQMTSQLSGFDTQSIAKGPSPPRPATPELIQESSTNTSVTSATGRLSHDVSTATKGVREFIAFSPPRNDSTCTSSTTSSCSAAIVSYAAATAVVPSPGAPMVEDEIWDEYNDLLGEAPPSATSSRGRPFYLENVTKQLESPTINVEMCIPTIDASLTAPKIAPLRISNAPTISSVYSQDITIRHSDSPATPFSVSEFVGGYGDRKHSIDTRIPAEAGTHNIFPSEPIAPLPHNTENKVSGSQRSSASSRKSKRTNSSASSRLTAEDQSPLAQVNLRVGSMTVSKWLTLGHVLFSPVRNDLDNLASCPDSEHNCQSILVIDGLGNDDWSFYAAETYPCATFFNLSPRAPLTEEQKRASAGGFPLSPANHHQVKYADHLSRFPFGTDSFTAIVYRFPVAAPESYYRNIIGEARRVLKPGGFIELSILDVDFNNMGNRGRRAIRGLKEKIHTTKPNVNLSSTADLTLKLLNRRGFIDVKTCNVGVPVCAVPKVKEKKPKQNPLEQRSLADMMSDTSEVADNEITNMVGNVGRWWYSKCYEVPGGIGPNSSMWRDRALLNECQELGTSLKLMVCYAKVPEKGGLGRVASI